MAGRSSVKSRFLGSTEGVSALEFAIIAPVAVLILFGVISYGLIFTLHLELQHLLAETSRATIPGLDARERRTLAEAEFGNRTGRYPFLDAAAASVDVEDDGRATRVRIVYDPTHSPAWLFEGLLPLPETPLVYEQTIRNGGRS